MDLTLLIYIENQITQLHIHGKLRGIDDNFLKGHRNLMEFIRDEIDEEIKALEIDNPEKFKLDIEHLESVLDSNCYSEEVLKRLKKAVDEA
jgi:hypothetical protein